MLLASRQEPVIISPTNEPWTCCAGWHGSFGQSQWSRASAPADRPLTNPDATTDPLPAGRGAWRSPGIKPIQCAMVALAATRHTEE